MSLGSLVQKGPVYLLSSVPFLLLSTVRRELLKHITRALTAPKGCGPRGGVALESRVGQTIFGDFCLEAGFPRIHIREKGQGPLL